MDFITPIISVELVADSQRYTEDEYPTIERYIKGAQSLLFKAGAFHPEDPLTVTAIEMIVGHWLENRDLMGFDFKSVDALPIGITAVINVLRFYPTPEATEKEIIMADKAIDELTNPVGGEV
ncbi:head-tail connector protein [Eremococcus coleocola]|uniref:head-tail connector protein n=1 Tax=Eremococcus coleocola TaxID=88132 RepID=UPI0004068AE6|nr:head-tail connector protein [Eremococcus coleocola]